MGLTAAFGARLHHCGWWLLVPSAASELVDSVRHQVP